MLEKPLYCPVLHPAPVAGRLQTLYKIVISGLIYQKFNLNIL